MSTEIPISRVEIAEDSELRSMKARLSSKSIITPFTATITKNFYKETEFPQDLAVLNETFFRFNEDTLDRFNKDLKYSESKNKAVAKSRHFLPNSDSVCMVEFRNSNEEVCFPSDEEIKVLVNAAYSFSDITPIPSIPKVARKININNFDEFKGYLSTTYDQIMIRNKKRILGYLPTTAPFFTEKLIDFYLDKGINGYYIDFDGTMVTSHLTMMNAIKRKLAERGYNEKNFLYYSNVSYGKAINDQNVLSARDLLAFGHGLDCLGGIHMGQKRNKNFYEWLKKQKTAASNTVRLLNKEDYGYYRLNSEDTVLENIFPEDSSISIDEIDGANQARIKRIASIINLEQQSIESGNLERLVGEDPDKTINYFEEKEMVSDMDIKRLSRK
jgi:hypothetical protein